MEILFIYFFPTSNLDLNKMECVLNMVIPKKVTHTQFKVYKKQE
jgi:hypothetical protein